MRDRAPTDEELALAAELILARAKVKELEALLLEKLCGGQTDRTDALN